MSQVHTAEIIEDWEVYKLSCEGNKTPKHHRHKKCVCSNFGWIHAQPNERNGLKECLNQLGLGIDIANRK